MTTLHEVSLIPYSEPERTIRNHGGGAGTRGTHIDCGDVHSVSFNNIHQIIRRCVRLSNRNVCVCYSVFAQNGSDLVVVDICERYSVCDGYATLILLPNSDRRRFLVQSDPKTFEFGFDDFLVAEGFEHVQDDKD